MSIDFSETLLSLTEAAQTLPGRPHLSTLHRWWLHGVRGVRLETILVGGRRFTSAEALERFAAATTAAANGQPPPVRTTRRRRLAVEAAERKLGIVVDADPKSGTQVSESESDERSRT